MARAAHLRRFQLILEFSWMQSTNKDTTSLVGKKCNLHGFQKNCELLPFGDKLEIPVWCSEVRRVTTDQAETTKTFVVVFTRGLYCMTIYIFSSQSGRDI